MMINPMTPQRAAVLTVLQQVEIAAVTGMKYGNVALLRMRTDGQTEHAPSVAGN
jgi:hypothetical protein